MPVLTVDYRAENASELFARSLKETGFAVLTHHPLNWPDIEAAYQEWHAFFNSDAKHQYPFKKETQDGYIPPTLSETAKGFNVKDIKEFFHLYFPHGRYPAEISGLTRLNFQRQFELGQTLLNWIEKHLPASIRSSLSCPLSEMVSQERSLYRILYYPPLTGAEAPGAIRAAAHEDINLITILPAATNPGLQVKNAEGQWMNVKVDPEAIVVNIGDMLQEATQGYYISTTHQVVNPTGPEASKPRLSMPLFVHPKPEVVLSAQYTADSYLIERLKELGLK